MSGMIAFSILHTMCIQSTQLNWQLDYYTRLFICTCYVASNDMMTVNSKAMQMLGGSCRDLFYVRSCLEELRKTTSKP
jgi:hypothetical protein